MVSQTNARKLTMSGLQAVTLLTALALIVFAQWTSNPIRGSGDNCCVTNLGLITPNNSEQHFSSRSTEDLSSIRLAIEKRQMERRRQYKAYCKQHGHKLRNAVAPDNRNLPGMMVVDKYKLLFCRLAKVGHSNWLRLILQLNSKLTSEQAATAPLHSTTTAHFFPELAFTKRFIPGDVRYRLKNYFKVIFVRHPLDRLLSAYEDKMGELSSTRNYYLKAFGAKIVSLCRKPANNDYTNKTFINSAVTNVTFSEFLCYVSKAPEYNLDWHWQPYWTFCQLCEPTWRFDFIGEYEYVAEESNHVLDLLGIKHLRYPLHGYRTDRERRERFVRIYSAISPHLVDAIWRRFKVDFDVFGYKLYPNFWYKT